jgi:uncharacterized protein (DUF1330 family)
MLETGFERPLAEGGSTMIKHVTLVVGFMLLAAFAFAGEPDDPAEAADTKAYLVGLVTVKNKDWVKDYRPKTAELLKKYGGRILVRGKPAEVLEGSAPEADAILVVEFPSMEKASAWYNDPDYQPLIELRQTGAEVDFVLVKGLTP